MRRAAVAAAVGLLVAGSGGTAPAGGLAKISPTVRHELRAGQTVDVIVTLADQANLTHVNGHAKILDALQQKATSTQKALRVLLAARRGQGRVSRIVPFWIFNGLEVTAQADVIDELASRPEVLRITPNATIQAPVAPAPAAAAEPNLALVNAPALWDAGFRGQGVVVANMDTGVDATQPELSARWRGGTNSWYDPNGEHPTTPTDVSGHGTWTMGVMVGGSAGGTAVGVAPDAKWIAVKIFNDAGTATTAGIHQGFQWLLDPDGNPSTADAPDVVNNSWTFSAVGCDLSFQADLRSLRAIGILPVFAAGNLGPGGSTSASPANNPEAFAVGATDNAGAVFSGSSRGPSACGESSTVFPELVAPGVGIRTTDLYGGYVSQTGTSLAAPHVSGALALLLQAFPTATVQQQEAALENGAVDLGPAGPDNDFGYGRLNILAAYNWLKAQAPPPPPSPDLVAAYGFDEASGATVADASGNGNAGTISGASRTTAGRFGSALSFDGVNDWVTVPDASSLDLTGGMTVEAWVKPSALSGWRTVALKEQPSALAYALYAETDAGRPSAHVSTPAESDTRGNGQIPVDTWTHLAATYDGATLRLYVGGSLVSSRAVGGDITVSTGALRVGGNSVWAEWFAGVIDELRIYKRALTATEIQADMTTPVGGGSPPPPPPPPPPRPPGGTGPVASYSFDAGSGTSVADASGNALNGSISGATWSAAGKYGGALSFDGVNDFVSVADAPPLDLSDAMTLEAWVNPAALGTAWRTVIIKEQSSNLVYALYANTDTRHPSGHIFVGADTYTMGTATLAANTWTHLAATYDGATLRLYVNGTQVGSLDVSGAMPSSTGAVKLGGNAVWGEWFKGKLDDVRIYARALTAGEIQADMSNPVTP